MDKNTMSAEIISWEETNSFYDPDKSNNGGGYSQPKITLCWNHWNIVIKDTSCGDFGDRIFVTAINRRTSEKMYAYYGSMVEGDLEYSDFDESDIAHACMSDAIYEATGYRIPTRQELEWLHMDEYEQAEKIVQRAYAEELYDGDKQDLMMDIISANKKFCLRMKDWYNAGKFNFAHDLFGIMNNIQRTEYPATDFGYFVPRFSQ